MAKSKSDLIKEMQIIAEEIEKHKNEVESILIVIQELNKKYFIIAEQIKNNQ